MAIAFTEKQQQVIDERNCNLLVSAAAGSGKTAVLVERIVKMICDKEHPVDIDRLLVVTFTSAAAAEMRERVSNAINDRLASDPENEHLQRQATLLHNAQITTIDSFCLSVLRNQFHTIGLDPGFRIGDEGEVKLLQADVLAEVLEQQYASEDPEFLFAMEYFSTGSRDDAVEDIVSRLYDFAMSNPFPEEWLEQRRGDYSTPAAEEGARFEELPWVRELLEETARLVRDCAEKLREAQRICEEPDGPYFYGELLEREEEMLEKLLAGYERQEVAFDEIAAGFDALKFDRLPSKKDDSVNALKREMAKTLRTEVKETLNGLREAYFFQTKEQILSHMKVCERATCALIDLVLAFKEAYDAKKREKNLLDFDDVEHLALSVLVRRTEDGKTGPTETALEYRSFFHEIMIDEYQDSNLVQEYLLSAISGESEGRYNRFMVGDVKQSIYKFRLARPELFLEKYQQYAEAERQGEKTAKKIDLHQNFRSRREVLESTNGVFVHLMGEAVGGIVYDDQAALHLGADYPEPESEGENDTELLLFQTGDRPDELSVKEQEAYGVAAKIKELLRTFRVTQRGPEGMSLRKVSYRDIVILLRTTSGWDEVFKRVLEEQGIPVHMTSRTGYFAAGEVQELLHFLRVLDNPLQDIPLYGAMHSWLGGFSDEEIALIRADGKREAYLYDALCRFPQGDAVQEDARRELQKKAQGFCGMVSRYRRMAAYLSVQELLQTILRETDYLHYVAVKPDGSKRRANVEMLLVRAAAYEKSSYFGLYHFLRYMEQLEKYEVDYGEAGLLDENADVVRLMSIHKSKGLEFPVCFVCGLSKHFQTRDASAHLVVDMDAGIGVDYVDPGLRVRGKDVRRKVVADKIRRDNLAEELRILYVAMTRAKEKLILTGTLKSAEKTAMSLLPLRAREELLLPYERFLSASSFLDLVLAALAQNQCMDEFYEGGAVPVESGNPHYLDQLFCKVRLLPWEESVEEALEERLARDVLNRRLLLSDEKRDTDAELMTYMSECFSYRYPHENLATLYTKTTVSELKKAGMQETEEAAAVLFEEEPVVPYLPQFVKNDENVSGTQRGTAFHKVMELLDFAAFYKVTEASEKDGLSREQAEGFLKKELERMLAAGKLPEEYRAAVSTEKLAAFLQSGAAARMARAALSRKLYKEQPFVLGIPANRLKEEFPESETVLVQGIIDVFFEEEDGLVVLDYKTDAVKTAGELIQRYRVQLDYYAQALEQIYGRPVKEKIIYSFKLGKEISF